MFLLLMIRCTSTCILLFPQCFVTAFVSSKQGHRVDRFRLIVLGGPATWITWLLQSLVWPANLMFNWLILQTRFSQICVLMTLSCTSFIQRIQITSTTVWIHDILDHVLYGSGFLSAHQHTRNLDYSMVIRGTCPRSSLQIHRPWKDWKSGSVKLYSSSLDIYTGWILLPEA